MSNILFILSTLERLYFEQNTHAFTRQHKSLRVLVKTG